MPSEIRLGTAILGFRADVRQYLRSLTAVEKAIRRQQRAVYRMNRAYYQLQRRISSFATSMTSLRAIVVGALGGGLVVRTVADFEQGMATVQAISGATGRELQALRARALELGATMPLTATNAAEGMQLLARAGFSADEVFKSIGGTLNLAIIGQLGLARASDIASNILTGFSLAAEEQNRVTDVLAKTTTRSNTNIQQLGDAMKFVAPISATVGATLEETAAALGILGDAGLQATIGGTGFRRFLLSLEAPTVLALKQLNSMGISIDEVRVSTVGLRKSLERLRPLATAENLGKAFNVFGARGTPAFVILNKRQQQLFDLNEELLNSAGYAQNVADVMKDNLAGAFKEVRSALEGLAIAVGDLGLTEFSTQRLQDLANRIRAVIGGIRGLGHEVFPEIAADVEQLTRHVLTNLNPIKNAFILLGFVILRHTFLGKFIINAIKATAATLSLNLAIKQTRVNYVKIGEAIDKVSIKLAAGFQRFGAALYRTELAIRSFPGRLRAAFVQMGQTVSSFRNFWNASWAAMRATANGAIISMAVTTKATMAVILTLLGIGAKAVRGFAILLKRVVWPIAVIEGLFFTVRYVQNLITEMSRLDVTLSEVITVAIAELVKFVVDALGAIPVKIANVILGSLFGMSQAIISIFRFTFSWVADAAKELGGLILDLITGKEGAPTFAERFARLRTSERLRDEVVAIYNAGAFGANLIPIDTIFGENAGEFIASGIRVIGGVTENEAEKIKEGMYQAGVDTVDEYVAGWSIGVSKADLDAIELPGDQGQLDGVVSNISEQMDALEGAVTETFDAIGDANQKLADELGRAFGNFAKDVILDFDNIEDAAKSLLNAILNSLATRFIADPIAQSVSALFAGLFGGIGAAQHGGRHSGLTLVGEAGPELVDFRDPARVYSNERLREAIVGQAASGSGAAVSVNLTINSADAGAVERAVYDSLPYIVDTVKGAVSADMQRPSALGASIRGV